LLFTVTSTNGMYTPLPPEQKWLKLVCNVNIVYGNLKSKNSQYYAHKETLTKLYVHEFGFRTIENIKVNAMVALKRTPNSIQSINVSNTINVNLHKPADL
jgi:hypothetical protein